MQSDKIISLKYFHSNNLLSFERLNLFFAKLVCFFFFTPKQGEQVQGSPDLNGAMCSYKTMFCDTGARAMPSGANVRGGGTTNTPRPLR